MERTYQCSQFWQGRDWGAGTILCGPAHRHGLLFLLSVAMGLAACTVGWTLVNALYGHLAAWEQLIHKQFPLHLVLAEPS